MSIPRRAGALRRHILTIALVACGVALPFVRVATEERSFRTDFDWYRAWAGCLSPQYESPYLSCSPPSPLGPPNYPALGIVATGGAIRALRLLSPAADAETERQSFRFYLAAFDALAFLALAWLARTMGFPRPLLAALAVMLLPSSWTSSAVWGQIDALLLCAAALCVASVFALVSARPPRRPAQDAALLGAALLSAAALVLLKQLAILAAPFLAMLLAFGAWRAWERHGRPVVPWLAAALLAALGLFRVVDAWYPVPKGFGGSSVAYTLELVRHQGSVISGNGFNVWMLLGRDMWSSSRVPFATLPFPGEDLSATPYRTGLILYAAFLAATSLVLVRAFWASRSRRAGDPAHARDRWTLAVACLFFGLSQLAYNVLLSGTHERYLYLGYPFVLLGLGWFVREGAASRRLLAGAAIAAIGYGLFVFSIFGPIPDLLFPFRRHEFLAAVHLGLLVALTDVWVRLAWRGPAARAAGVAAPALAGGREAPAA